MTAKLGKAKQYLKVTTDEERNKPRKRREYNVVALSEFKAAAEREELD